MSDVMPCYLTSCESFARAGGEVLRQWQGKVNAREKAKADLVTEADEASEKLIRSLISKDFPEHGFVGEESSIGSSTDEREYCWVVDPLDGTTNYVHGLPGWCVSVALVREGVPLVGCVYDVEREHCYTAKHGEGAHLNGQSLQVSRTTKLNEALIAVSFPAGIERDSPEIHSFLNLVPEIRAFRRLGSAALNLCYLASGKLDAYWTGKIQPWDVAAGGLIVQEAGGVITSAKGEPWRLFDPTLAAASSPELNAQLVEKLAVSSR